MWAAGVKSHVGIGVFLFFFNLLLVRLQAGRGQTNGIEKNKSTKTHPTINQTKLNIQLCRVPTSKWAVVDGGHNVTTYFFVRVPARFCGLICTDLLSLPLLRDCRPLYCHSCTAETKKHPGIVNKKTPRNCPSWSIHVFVKALVLEVDQLLKYWKQPWSRHGLRLSKGKASSRIPPKLRELRELA